MPGGVGDFWGLRGVHDLEGEIGGIRRLHDLVEMWGLLGALSDICNLEEGTGGGFNRLHGLDGATQRPQWGSWCRAGHGKL